MKNTRLLAEIAVCIALAFVCRFIKVFEMPQGGSVALTTIPILLISFRRGPAAGIVTGMVYSLISLMVDGHIYHPLSVLLDYIIAFGLLGVSGFFKATPKGLTSGVIAGNLCRYISCVISGAVVFASYAPEGKNVWLYSLGYNAAYIVPETIIGIAVLMLIYLKANKLLKAK